MKSKKYDKRRNNNYNFDELKNYAHLSKRNKNAKAKKPLTNAEVISRLSVNRPHNEPVPKMNDDLTKVAVVRYETGESLQFECINSEVYAYEVSNQTYNLPFKDKAVNMFNAEEKDLQENGESYKNLFEAAGFNAEMLSNMMNITDLSCFVVDAYKNKDGVVCKYLTIEDDGESYFLSLNEKLMQLNKDNEAAGFFILDEKGNNVQFAEFEEPLKIFYDESERRTIQPFDHIYKETSEYEQQAFEQADCEPDWHDIMDAAHYDYSGAGASYALCLLAYVNEKAKHQERKINVSTEVGKTQTREADGQEDEIVIRDINLDLEMQE